jgi:hypothetical protein
MIFCLIWIGYALFGFGAAGVMFFLFGVVTRRVPRGHLLANLLKVLSWFTVNGAFVVGTFNLISLDRALDLPHANGYSLLGYLCGFGLTAGLLAIGRSRLRRKGQGIKWILQEVMSNAEAEVVLLVLRYHLSLRDAAARMGIRESMARKHYARALAILGGLGEN